MVGLSRWHVWVLLLGERPSVGVLLGGLVVLTGVAMIVLARPDPDCTDSVVPEDGR